MEKFLKILFINILVICTLIIVTEFICICLSCKIINGDIFYLKTHIIKAIKSYANNSHFKAEDFREPSIAKSNKKPIAIMGCSYVYGYKLKENETISAVLSKLTNRTVYNLGVIGTSPREMLYILQDEQLRTKLFNNQTNFEYIIYPYISNHRFRLYTDIKPFTYSPYFKETENGLEYTQNNNFFIKTYIYKKFLDFKYSKINDTEAFRLMCTYLKEINKEIKKHFKNTKFVILVYEDYLNENWNILESEGIIIIKLKNFLDIDVKSPQYTLSPDDMHPNAKAWEVVTPVLTKALNL